MAFAKLDSSVTVPTGLNDGEEEEDTDSETGHAYAPKVGDYVQWEHNGVLGFPEPKRIREISSDGAYVFIEGQYTGIPANELIPEKAPAVKPVTQTPLPPQTPSKMLMLEFVVPLSDGSRAVFQWPSALTQEDILDLKDSLKILERKIDRSTKREETARKAAE